MSVRNRFLLPIVFLSLAFLVACGGSSGTVTHPTPPPTGNFSNADLNGTYVFTTSGTDSSPAPYAIVGSFTANGNGGITGGVLDIADESFSSPGFVANQGIGGNSTYKVGVDGRGQATLVTSTPFGKIVLDFVLQDKSGGLVTEFDNNASGSGTLDLQTSGAKLSGSYAFEFAGATSSSSAATVGNFTVPSGGGAITAGLEDLNTAGVSSADQAMTGAVVLGPSSTPATNLTITSTSHTVTYDVYAIDSTHLKFIEMDGAGTLNGDAFAQTSTSLPASSTLAFTLMGNTIAAPATPVAAGGYMVTDSSGNITSSSSEDVNAGGASSTVSFSATSAATGTTGRFTLNLSGFFGGSGYAAYPSSGGLLLLEVDDLGIMVGAANVQSSTTFTESQGYALNLTGTNLGASTGSLSEVDDIAEFTASGGTATGVIDENAPGVGPNYGLLLSGNYTAPGSSGRGSVTANAGNSTNSTLNGGFALTFYSVDGTTFPFIETDNGQVASGVLVLQNSNAASTAIARSPMMVVRPLVRPGETRRRQAE